MTEEEYKKFFIMGACTFRELKNPTAEQCLAFLHYYILNKGGYTIPEALEFIPEKQREFCKSQLKLEGIDIDE